MCLDGHSFYIPNTLKQAPNNKRIAIGGIKTTKKVIPRALYVLPFISFIDIITAALNSMII